MTVLVDEAARYVRMTTIIEGAAEVQKVITARSMGLN